MSDTTYPFTLTYPTIGVTDDTVSKTEIQTDLTDLLNITNALYNTPLSVANHPNCTGSTLPYHSDASVIVTDEGDYFTGTNVRTVLQEVGAKIGSSSDTTKKLLKCIGSKSAPSTTTSGFSITVPANTVTDTDEIIIKFGKKIGHHPGNRTNKVVLAINGTALADNDESVYDTNYSDKKYAIWNHSDATSEFADNITGDYSTTCKVSTDELAGNSYMSTFTPTIDLVFTLKEYATAGAEGEAFWLEVYVW